MAAYAQGDRVTFDDPDFGLKHGRVSYVYPDGDLEVAVSLGPRDSRSLVYTLSPGDQRLSLRPSHLWPCGCLRNDAGAHRAGCPDYPEGVRG